MVAPLVHLETSSGVAPHPIRRLALIGGDGAATRLRLSRADQKRLDTLQHYLGSMAGLSEVSYRDGSEVAWDVALLHGALMSSELDAETSNLIRLGSEAKFPIRANDLMPEYVGPMLGAKLRELERLWIDSRFTLERADLMKSV